MSVESTGTKGPHHGLYSRYCQPACFTASFLETNQLLWPALDDAVQDESNKRRIVSQWVRLSCLTDTSEIVRSLVALAKTGVIRLSPDIVHFIVPGNEGRDGVQVWS